MTTRYHIVLLPEQLDATRAAVMFLLDLGGTALTEIERDHLQGVLAQLGAAEGVTRERITDEPDTPDTDDMGGPGSGA